MTSIVHVVCAVRPRESVTTAVNVISPAACKMPVVSVDSFDDQPPPETEYDLMVLPYTPTAPDRLTAALPMPRTNCPVPLVSSVTAAVSLPAEGTTLLGIVSVMLTDFVPSSAVPEYVSQ